MTTTLIKNAYIISMDDKIGTIKNGDVLISGRCSCSILLGQCLKHVHRPQHGRGLHPYLSEPPVEQLLDLSAPI